MIEWELPLDDVVVEPQHRADLGDLTELAASIALTGLVRPLVLTPDGNVLLSGSRRLAAIRELGMSHVPVAAAETLPEAAQMLAEDLAEETGQLAMDARGRASLGRALEDLPRPPGSGDARRHISGALGMSEHAWQRLRIVAEAVDNGELEPEVFEEIDEADSPTPVWKRLMAKRDGPVRPDEKKKRFVINSDRTRSLADTAKRRFSKALGGLDGYREGLEHLDVRKVVAASSDQELEAWQRVLAKTQNTLKEVRAELQREDNQ